MADVVDLAGVRERAEKLRQHMRARQGEVDATLSEPASLKAAEEICTPITTEDGARTLGVGLFPPPEGKAWCLTPEQADALALELVRDANKVRARWEREGQGK